MIKIEKINFNCVWKNTGELMDFALSDIPEHSTLSLKKNKSTQKTNKLIKVETISFIY